MRFLKIAVIASCLVACTLCLGKRQGTKNSSQRIKARINRGIKKYLKFNESRKNILKLLTWNLNGQEEIDVRENFCDVVERSGASVLGLQQIRISHMKKLKDCFQKINTRMCKREKPRRRKNKKNEKRRSRHRQQPCGFQLKGAGNVNTGNEEETIFSPVIFRLRRGIRYSSHGTFWLSQNPGEAFSKLEDATTVRIASWTHLKLAVFDGGVNKNTAEEQESNESSGKKKRGKNKGQGVENLFSTLKRVLKPRRRTTKWIDLFVVNTQLDDVDANVAKQQLQILMEELKAREIGTGEHSAVLLTAGINPEFSDEVSKVMENNKGDVFLNIRENARMPIIKQRFPETTTVWCKGLENMFSFDVSTEDENQKLGPVLSVLAYK